MNRLFDENDRDILLLREKAQNELVQLGIDRPFFSKKVLNQLNRNNVNIVQSLFQKIGGAATLMLFVVFFLFPTFTHANDRIAVVFLAI
ncbi:MAG: hypothetical protein ACK4VO_06900 [Pseudobdellovibrio sp.]